MFLLSQSIRSLLGPPGAQHGTTKAQGGLVESPWEDQGGGADIYTNSRSTACMRPTSILLIDDHGMGDEGWVPLPPNP